MVSSVLFATDLSRVSDVALECVAGWKTMGLSKVTVAHVHTIEHSGVGVELVDASRKLNLHRDGAVLRMVNTLDLAVYPVITVNDEIISMGPPVMDELAPLLLARLGGHDE